MRTGKLDGVECLESFRHQSWDHQQWDHQRESEYHSQQQQQRNNCNNNYNNNNNNNNINSPHGSLAIVDAFADRH